MKNPNFTPTKAELAELCGVSRPTLNRFLSMPGAPTEDKKQGWPVDLVRDFILKNTEKESISANLNSEIGDLKKWEIFERARKSKLANDQKEGSLIPRHKHEAILSEMAHECQTVLNGIPRKAPELAGLPTHEIERVLQDSVDEAVEKLHNGN